MTFVKITEQPSSHGDLDKMSVRELLEGINDEDARVAPAVRRTIPQLEKLVTAVVERMRRGGRISSATALIGTVLSIKPILCGDETGHIVSCGKVRGMKRAYQELANYYDGRALDKSEMLGIAHADNEEGAQALIALLRDKGFTGECLNVVYEPVTGAHVGPGTVALFFYGTEK